jgi:hypothetical protein
MEAMITSTSILKLITLLPCYEVGNYNVIDGFKKMLNVLRGA